MNPHWIAAGFVALLTTLVHVFLGGDDVVVPMLQGIFDEEAKAVLYVVWHMCSGLLGLTALALLHAGIRGGSDKLALTRFLALQYVMFSALFLWWGPARFGVVGLWRLPQWVLLLPIAWLCYRGGEQVGQRSGNTSLNAASV